MKLKFFEGQSDEPTGTYEALKQFPVNPENIKDPKGYRCSKELAAAVETALILGMPLLLTGEPGCGKSQLAYRVAWEMGFPLENPILFTVKSTTEARDFFYRFDTVGRFHAAQSEDKGSDLVEPRHFIHYEGLGLALLRSKGKCKVKDEDKENELDLKTILNDEQFKSLPEAPERSVLLIDEIDKAQRDVPNDLLNEIDRMSFDVPELRLPKPIALNTDKEKLNRPFVIITSNSERDLPDAFLRRCVYHHVGFPAIDESELKDSEGQQTTLKSIITSRFTARFNKQYQENAKFIEDVLSLCKFIRSDSHNLTKKPSLAEILNWLDFLEKQTHESIDIKKGLRQLDEKYLLKSVQNILLKTSDDQPRAKELIDGWNPDKKKSS